MAHADDGFGRVQLKGRLDGLLVLTGGAAAAQGAPLVLTDGAAAAQGVRWRGVAAAAQGVRWRGVAAGAGGTRVVAAEDNAVDEAAGADVDGSERTCHIRVLSLG